MPWTLRYQRFDKPYQTLMVNFHFKGPRLIIFILRKQNKNCTFHLDKKIYLQCWIIPCRLAFRTSLDPSQEISFHDVQSSCEQKQTHTYIKDTPNPTPKLANESTTCQGKYSNTQSRPVTMNLKNDFQFLSGKFKTCLNEADVFSVLSEALAAHVEPVFTDQSVSVWAYPAEIRNNRLICGSRYTFDHWPQKPTAFHPTNVKSELASR